MDRRRSPAASISILPWRRPAREWSSLRNERAALPLDREGLRSITVIGELADRANIGDRGSSRVKPPYVVT